MQKKYIGAVLFLLQIGMLIGCGQAQNATEIRDLDGQSVESEGDAPTDKTDMGEVSEPTADIADTETTQETEEVPQSLHFVDAWGEWHDCIIDPEVPKHTYDWDGLGRDGELVTYENDSRFRVRYGVDVSKYQGKIDWQRVKEAGIDFAIVRIGYRGYGNAGNLKADDCYARNIEEARKTGMDVGVYFFSQAINEEEATEEADFVIGLLDGYELQLPVVYDPELIRDDVARTDEVTGKQFTANTIAFCERIKEAGYQPMIYSNMVWESELFDLKQLQDYPIWYADYELIPQTPYNFVMWQYTEKGNVDGISGIVDRNVWFVPTEE